MFARARTVKLLVTDRWGCILFGAGAFIAAIGYMPAEGLLAHASSPLTAATIMASAAVPLLLCVLSVLWPRGVGLRERLVVAYAVLCPTLLLMILLLRGTALEGIRVCMVCTSIPLGLVGAAVGRMLGRAIHRRIGGALNVRCACGGWILRCDQRECPACGRTWSDLPPRCLKCGYLLIGIVSARCPECGTPIHDAKK